MARRGRPAVLGRSPEQSGDRGRPAAGGVGDRQCLRAAGGRRAHRRAQLALHPVPQHPDRAQLGAGRVALHRRRSAVADARAPRLCGRGPAFGGAGGPACGSRPGFELGLGRPRDDRLPDGGRRGTGDTVGPPAANRRAGAGAERRDRQPDLRGGLSEHAARLGDLVRAAALRPSVHAEDPRLQCARLRGGLPAADDRLHPNLLRRGAALQQDRRSRPAADRRRAASAWARCC